MALVAAKCPQCSGGIKVNTASRTANCPYCGTEFITENVINNYSITNNTNIDADVVNVHMDTAKDRLLNSAEELMRAGNYEKALQAFSELVTVDKFDYRGYWGMIRAKSCGFTADFSKDNHTLSMINAWYNESCSLCSQEIKEEIRETYMAYYDGMMQKQEDAVRYLEATKDELQKSEDDKSAEIARLQSEYSFLGKLLTPLFYVAFAVLAFLSLGPSWDASYDFAIDIVGDWWVLIRVPVGLVICLVGVVLSVAAIAAGVYIFSRIVWNIIPPLKHDQKLSAQIADCHKKLEKIKEEKKQIIEQLENLN